MAGTRCRQARGVSPAHWDAARVKWARIAPKRKTRPFLAGPCMNFAERTSRGNQQYGQKELGPQSASSSAPCGATLSNATPIFGRATMGLAQRGWRNAPAPYVNESADADHDPPCSKEKQNSSGGNVTCLHRCITPQKSARFCFVSPALL